MDDEPTYTRSRVVNVQEEIQIIIQAAPYLSEDYVTRKILTLLGDADQADDIINKMAADEIDKLSESEEEETEYDNEEEDK